MTEQTIKAGYIACTQIYRNETKEIETVTVAHVESGTTQVRIRLGEEPIGNITGRMIQEMEAILEYKKGYKGGNSVTKETMQ